ncbi:tight adherence protein C [Azospirillaceae bacterium]
MLDALGINPEDAVSLLAGVAAFIVTVLVWAALIESDPLSNRLRTLAERRQALKSGSTAPRRRRRIEKTGMMRSVVQRLKLAKGQTAEDGAMKLAQAGMRSHDALVAYLFAKASLPLVLGVASLATLYGAAAPDGATSVVGGGTSPLMSAIVCALIGARLPDLYLSRRARGRLLAIRGGLADAFDLLVICAEAGLGLDAAFDRLAREMAQSYPELSEEIGLTAVELSFLPDRSKALQGLANRVPLPSVRALINCLTQTERYGTPLAQALRVLSNEQREERILRAEEKAARLPAILTAPLMIFILPPLFIILIGPAVIHTIDAMGN